MFVCSICGKHSNRREPEIPVVLEIKEMLYENKESFSFGWQIVREGRVPASHNHSLRRGPLVLNDSDKFSLPMAYQFYPTRLTIHRLVEV